MPAKKKAKKKAAKKKSAKAKRKKRAPNVATIAFNMLKDRRGAKKLLESFDLPRNSVLKLAKKLEGETDLIKVVEAYRTAKGYPAKGETAGRGRAPALPGEERTYKAQQPDTGGPFVRQPLDVLGKIKQGQSIKMKFEKDKIITTLG